MDGKDGNGTGGTSENRKKSPKTKKIGSSCLKHKEVLKKNLVYLCQSTTNIGSLAIYMRSKSVISESDEERIRNANVTTEEKVRELIGIVMRKDKEAYDILLKGLLKTSNEHVSKRLNTSGDETESDADNDDKKRRKKKKRSRKSGKMFTIYDANFSDETSSDEELDKFEKFDPDIESLFDYLAYVEWYLHTIKYHPQKLYNLTRFDKIADLINVHPMKTFNNSLLQFKVNRSVFLKGVGLYGPGQTTRASYQIEIKLITQMSMDEHFIIAETKGVFELEGNRSITYIHFEKPQPIRPHMWHMIQFSIKGQDEMAIQPEANIETRREMEMIHDGTNNGNVIFEFDKQNSTGQIPELCFFRGKDAIGFEHFPRHYLSTVDYAETLSFYTAKRFETPNTFLTPIEHFNKSIQRFRVDRPIYLKSVGFFGPGIPQTRCPDQVSSHPDQVPNPPEEMSVASYKIKLKLMTWRAIDEPCILQEVDALVEVKCGNLMYVVFRKATKISPHTWHWIEFTIIGTTPVGAGRNDERNQWVSVRYCNEIDDCGVKFEFDTSNENSTSQIPELRFYKANDVSNFAGDDNLQQLTPDAQKFYTAHRFNNTHPMDKPVIPSLRFTNSCQGFKVNRAIYLKKVGFFGPATPRRTATYEVNMKLVLWSTNKTPPFVIASTEKVVEVEHSKMMYIAFEKAQPIRPDTWHWIEFSIKGTEEMLVQNKKNKKTSDTVEYLFGGDVTFQFDITPCHSTCQMPELWFFKGEKEMDLSKFPKPKSLPEDEKTETNKCATCTIS